MPCLRQQSPMVSPLARSRSTSRKRRWIWSAVLRLPMSPSLDYARETTITAGPIFGEPTTFGAFRVQPLLLTVGAMVFVTPCVNRQIEHRKRHQTWGFHVLSSDGVESRPLGRVV